MKNYILYWNGKQDDKVLHQETFNSLKEARAAKAAKKSEGYKNVFFETFTT